MQRIDLESAKTHLPELVQQAVGGEDVVITKDDEPLVRLVAIVTPKHERQFGSAKGLITIGADFDEPLADFAEYQ